MGLALNERSQDAESSFRPEDDPREFQNSKIPVKMPSQHLRGVGRWDLHWMKCLRKGREDFRGRIILENSKCLNSSNNAISVSVRRRKMRLASNERYQRGE